MPECYVADAWRTPFARAGGPLAPLTPQELARQLTLPVHVRCPGLPGLQGLLMGNVLNGRGNLGRYAVLAAELPWDIPGATVDRQCASGMECIAQAATCVEASDAPVTWLAGGIESMSQAPYLLERPTRPYAPAPPGFVDVPLAPPEIGGSDMIDTAETVAAEAAIARADADAFALRSHERAIAAAGDGTFGPELEPVTVPGPRGRTARIEADHGPREDTSFEKLQRLPSVRGPDAQVTAGNASGISDGGAMTVVMNTPAIETAGVEPLARLRASVCVGVDPRRMGLGPVAAVNALLDREGLSVDRIDAWEINEAFAGQVLACTLRLGVEPEAVNTHGGAIALGHPLGASGARIVGHLARTLSSRDAGTLGVAALCVGGGMGMAMLLEAV